MIFIVVKFLVKDEYLQDWPEIVRPFTEATRAEPGNLWFEWSRSLESPNEYVVVEAFEEGEAPGLHVNSDHFRAMQAEFPAYLVSTPRIISTAIPHLSGWDTMSEITVEPGA